MHTLAVVEVDSHEVLQAGGCGVPIAHNLFHHLRGAKRQCFRNTRGWSEFILYKNTYNAKYIDTCLLRRRHMYD